MLHEQPVLWDFWIECQLWDSTFNPGIRLHHKLSSAAVNLDSSSKMRNCYADDALDNYMYGLMKDYCKMAGITTMDAAIELLDNTRHIVALFKDPEPIRSRNDPKLKKAKDALAFFKTWEEEVTKSETLTNKQKQKALISYQTRDDLECSITGFCEFVDMVLSREKNSYVLARTTNTDCVENIFCQARSVNNGPNNHPTVAKYGPTVTSIILSQGLFSLHGNTANNSTAAKPYKMCVNKPLRNNSHKKQKLF